MLQDDPRPSLRSLTHARARARARAHAQVLDFFLDVLLFAPVFGLYTTLIVVYWMCGGALDTQSHARELRTPRDGSVAYFLLSLSDSGWVVVRALSSSRVSAAPRVRVCVCVCVARGRGDARARACSRWWW